MPRKLERQALVHHLKVFNRNTKALLGYLQNIHAEGVGLFCPRPVKSDTAFTLEISLPGEVAGHDRIVFEANCRWCHWDASLNLFAAGFQIQRIEAEDQKRIAETIAAFRS